MAASAHRHRSDGVEPVLQDHQYADVHGKRHVDRARASDVV
jgi:hypothetical protein